LDRPPLIDPQKVLLIVDSSSTLSVQAADYYQAARGLGSHRISINMSADKSNGGSFTSGLGASATVLKSKYVDPVAAYIDANDIEGIVLSADVPERCYLPLTNTASAQQYLVSFPQVLANARWFSSTGFVESGAGQLSFSPTVNARVEVKGYYRNGMKPHIRPKLPGDTFALSDGFSIVNGVSNGVVLAGRMFPLKRGFRGESQFEYSLGAVPAGRLGLGLLSPGRESLSLVQQIIDAAVAAEGRTWEQTKAAGRRFHVGLHNRYDQFAWSPVLPAYLYEMLSEEGFDTVYWTRTIPTDSPVHGIYTNPAYTYNSLITNGTANGGAAWAFVGLAFANDGPGLTWPSRFQIQQGAWMLENTSFPQNPGVDLLMNGGVACMSNVTEPFTSGVPLIQYVLRNLMSGCSFMEANHHAGGGSKLFASVIGDPLYRPFSASSGSEVFESNRRLFRASSKKAKGKSR
jgi:hypothetical protein